MDKHPLVSVIVVCYNAAQYIKETLESVKAQTYKNIELIVSDDCSNDGTPDIVKEWLNKNSDAFVRTELVTIDHNTGVSANYNRAVRACRGEWVKNIDGDDLITEDCIQANIEFVNNNSNPELVFSNVMKFSGKGDLKPLGEFFSEDRKSFFKLDVEDQFKYLLNVNILPSQSCFIKRSLLVKYPYNEEYRGLEDAPMWLTLTRNGIKAFYFDKCTAYYRLDESMTSSKAKFFSPIYTESVKLFFWKEQYKYIKEHHLNDAYCTNRKLHLIMDFADGFLHNRKTMINNFIFRIVSRVVNRFAYFKL